MTNEELIAKIKAEIERRKNNAETLRERNICIDLLSFLSTLESEKPMNQDEDLNEEIKKFVAEYGYERSGDILLIAIVARHFAQWGADHSGSSETPKDLKEAVKNYIYKAADSPGDDWTTDDIRNAYISGYKLHEANTPLPEDTVLWNDGFKTGREVGAREQKEQMLKEAVEGRVYMSFAPGHNQMVMADVDLPTNTNVRVIVLPKED